MQRGNYQRAHREQLKSSTGQQRAVAAVERVLTARSDRILLSRATIAPIQWLVIFILAGLTLLTIAIVHIDRRTTVAVNLFIFSTAVAACLVLLMVNDRPFSTGGITIEPSALREIRID